MSAAPPAKKLKGTDGEAVPQEEGAEEIVEETVAMAVATPKAGAPAPAGEDTAMEEEKVEEPVKIDEDAKEDTRRKISAPVKFEVPDTTLNCMVSTHGSMLMMLNEGGLAYLFGGARANVGIKAGRYCFEVKIIELLNQAEAGMQIRSGIPKHVLRLGFSTGKSSMPIMGDTEDSICFDSDGAMLFNKKRTPLQSAKYGPQMVMNVVLNLDPESPSANTVSLFKDGKRVCDPQPLPESLRGKALFPTVTFKNMNIHVNFGPTQYAPLPFKCYMVQEAAMEDVELCAYQAPHDGKYQMIMPVCLPDEGGFDWLDWFLERNPHFSELSERMVVEWALRSGVFRPKTASIKASNDRPDMNFGMPHLDDGTVKQILVAAAATQMRDVVYMEVRGNLMKADRKEALSKFRLPHFTKVAKILMGEPTDEFRQAAMERLIEAKQAKIDAEFQVKRQQKAQLKLLEMQKKQVEWARKKAEKLAKEKAAEEARAAAIEKGEEPPEEEKKEEEEEKPDMSMEVDEEEQPPKAELTEDEKKECFAKKPDGLPDMSTALLSTSFAKFTIPEKEEGFDEVEYGWQDEPAAKEHIKMWAQERKVTTRIDDLAPSEWFKEKWQRWQKDLQTWHVRHMEYKDPVKRAVLLKAKEDAKKAAETGGIEDKKEEKKEEKTEDKKEDKKEEKKEEKKDEAKKDEKKADSKEAKTEDKKEDGKEKKKEGAEEKKEKDDKEKEAEKKAKEEKEDEDENLDYIKLLEEEMEQAENDVFAIDDVTDIGTGEPLFCNFTFEDWAMLSLRFEIHLLAHSFLHDCGDKERAGIYPDHLLFYYNRYYKKGLNPKNYGVDGVEDLLSLIKDTAVICGPKVVESQLTDELESNDIFVKLTEESRRDRQRRIDAGEEGAALKFAGRPDSAIKAAGSKAASPAAKVMAKGGLAQPNPLLAQQQRQHQLRQQMQQQMQQNVGVGGPVPVGVQQGWGGGRGGFRPAGVPLAQQRAMRARYSSWG
eukprot:TRINITY_DN56642_c0_g1_i1.p1 TRINITY_DN56642_c0_g1~~TRINITY_DN56642_c0_g1_i1.p1  ORF type:complete len:1014 (+),score=321.33 TRINITY_DN56642_c0_g1_i1:73-3042(+)